MTKEEFLRKLENKLEILDPKEVKDIIDEYSEHIDEKIKKGISEETAIKEFGSVNELASDILEAYKVNKNYASANNDFFTEVIDSCKNVFNKIIKILTHGNGKEIFNLIFYFLVIALVLLVVRIPFELINSFFADVASSFPVTVEDIFTIFMAIFINLSYIFLAFFIFVRMLNEKLNGNYEYVTEKVEEEIEKKGNSKKKSSNKEETIIKERVIYKNSGNDLLGSILKTTIKILVGFFSIPFIFTLLGAIIAMALVLEFSIKYFALYGGVAALFGIVIGLILCIEIMFRFIFDKKVSFGRSFVTFLISLIIFGVGVGYGTYEFSKIDVRDYINNYSSVETSEYVSDSPRINIYCHLCESVDKSRVTFIDNSIENNRFRIETYYDEKYFTVYNISSIDDFYYSNYDEQRGSMYSVSLHSNPKIRPIITSFFDNLKEGFVYDHMNFDIIRIKVYANEKTLNSINISN